MRRIMSSMLTIVLCSGFICDGADKEYGHVFLTWIVKVGGIPAGCAGLSVAHREINVDTGIESHGSYGCDGGGGGFSLATGVYDMTFDLQQPGGTVPLFSITREDVAVGDSGVTLDLVFDLPRAGAFGLTVDYGALGAPANCETAGLGIIYETIFLCRASDNRCSTAQVVVDGQVVGEAGTAFLCQDASKLLILDVPHDTYTLEVVGNDGTGPCYRSASMSVVYDATGLHVDGVDVGAIAVHAPRTCP